MSAKSSEEQIKSLMIHYGYSSVAAKRIAKGAAGLVEPLERMISCEGNDRECCGPTDPRDGEKLRSQCFVCQVAYYRTRADNLERDLAQARVEKDNWIETAEMYGRNSEHHRGKREEAEARAEALGDALRGLQADVKGVLRLEEQAIRELVGNTNVSCIKHWLQAAEDALKASHGSEGEG
jgi:hypothetical protein